MAKQRWFHAIGICGKTTSNVALMFKKAGWFVTGSDSQFFPPVSVQLEKENIPIVKGYHYSNLTKKFWEEKLNKKLNIEDVPQLCLIVDTLTSKNKEFLFAKKKGIKVQPYSQILGEYLVKEESIVVIGTAGKTTTTTLIVFLLQELGIDPSYMIGAETIDISESLLNTDSNFSVIEGDEYYSLELARGAKFLEYKPKYLVITKIDWEHQDIFPTQERYIEEFEKAVKLLPPDGLLIVKNGDKNIEKVIKSAKCKVIKYSLVDKLTKDPIWKVIKENNVYKIYNSNNEFILDFETKIIGDYNLENILAAVALILNLPARTLPGELVTKGTSNLNLLAEKIRKFNGVKKRLEIIHNSSKNMIIDDFGVTPDRANNSLTTIKKNFPDYRIIAIFEPNSGSRQSDLKIFQDMYSNSFSNADEVLIPDLSDVNPALISANDLVDRLKNLKFNASKIESKELVEKLFEKIKNENKKIIIIFFSSYRLTTSAYELKELLIKNNL